MSSSPSDAVLSFGADGPDRVMWPPAAWATGTLTDEQLAAVVRDHVRQAADSDRFPHDLHTSDDPTIRGFQGRGLACADCHPAEAVAQGKIARPGANQHFPCDVCHKDEFYKAPGAFCRNCHASVDPTKKGANSPFGTCICP